MFHNLGLGIGLHYCLYIQCVRLPSRIVGVVGKLFGRAYVCSHWQLVKHPFLNQRQGDL